MNSELVRKFTRPWLKLPKVMLYFSAFWFVGAVSLTSLRLALYKGPHDQINKNMTSPPVQIPAGSIKLSPNDLLAILSKPSPKGKVNFAKGGLESGLWSVSQLSEDSKASNWLNNDIFDLKGVKIGVIKNFITNQDGKITQVEIGLFKKKSDGVIKSAFAPSTAVKVLHKGNIKAYVLALPESSVKKLKFEK